MWQRTDDIQHRLNYYEWLFNGLQLASVNLMCLPSWTHRPVWGGFLSFKPQATFYYNSIDSEWPIVMVSHIQHYQPAVIARKWYYPGVWINILVQQEQIITYIRHLANVFTSGKIWDNESCLSFYDRRWYSTRWHCRLQFAKLLQWLEGRIVFYGIFSADQICIPLLKISLPLQVSQQFNL